MARLSFADHLKTSPGGPPNLSHPAVRHEKATPFSLQNPSVQHKNVSVQHKKVSVQNECVSSTHVLVQAKILIFKFKYYILKIADFQAILEYFRPALSQGISPNYQGSNEYYSQSYTNMLYGEHKYEN